jgi:hypothetical protein
MIIDSIKSEIERLQRIHGPKDREKQRLVIIINENATRELARWMLKNNWIDVINIDSKPRTIHGWPYMVDTSQKMPFRVVET